jgi:hypothetical protein
MAYKWYFAISEISLARPAYDWRGLIRAAVKSAKRNTSLLPHMIYDGKPNGFTAEIADMGVTIIPHRVSFYNDLLAEQHKHPDWDLLSMSGAFLRNEIPLLEAQDNVVIYTDCDVIFLKDPTISRPPTYFAATPEESKTDYSHINTGVLLMNVEALRKKLPDFTAYILDRILTGHPEDQPMYNEFYQGLWDRLDITLNWKPYWGEEPSAQIIHWHGPKPNWVHNYFKYPKYHLRNNLIWRRLADMNPEGYRHYLRTWREYGNLPEEPVLCTEDTLCTLDGFENGLPWGWAINPLSPSQPVRMVVYIDDERIGEIECSSLRPDLPRAGLPTEVAGWSFKLPERYRDGQRHRLELRLHEGGPLILIYAGGRPTPAYEFLTN